MEQLQNLIEHVTGMSPAFQNRILSSLMIILLLGLVRYLFLKYLWRKSENPELRYRWQKISVYIAFFLGVVLVGRVWFAGISSITTFLGLITAGLAIALQDIVKSIAGWFFLLWRRPFVVGDRVEIGDIKGDVIDIRLFKFTLAEVGNWVDADQSTGRVVHLSNHLILSEKIANYTQGFNFVWHEIPVLITFESDWKKAKTLLRGIAVNIAGDIAEEAKKHVKEASKKYLIYYKHVEPIVYTTVKDSGVLLTMRYMVNPRSRRGIEEAMWENILQTFAAEPDIDLAYPTVRYYRLPDESVTGTER